MERYRCESVRMITRFWKSAATGACKGLIRVNAKMLSPGYWLYHQYR